MLVRMMLLRTPATAARCATLGIWDALNAYTTTGFLPIDNNLVEREIRPLSIGRKSYMFLGSGEEGGGPASTGGE
jgi:hypothetical protein